jgi:hypothetical protein
MKLHGYKRIAISVFQFLEEALEGLTFCARLTLLHLADRNNPPVYTDINGETVIPQMDSVRKYNFFYSVQMASLARCIDALKITSLENEILQAGRSAIVRRSKWQQPDLLISISTETLDKDFECGICKGVIGEGSSDETPTQLRCNGKHVFCERCIERALAQDPRCSYCRQGFERVRILVRGLRFRFRSGWCF